MLLQVRVFASGQCGEEDAQTEGFDEASGVDRFLLGVLSAAGVVAPGKYALCWSRRALALAQVLF